MSYIEFNNVNLYFKVNKEKRIKDFFVNRNDVFNKMSDSGVIHALKNLNFNISDGDRVSIIGNNGAGKSTILKTISKIYNPTSGEVKTSGRVSSMFELATGFEMESNGWDNIYLRGLMLGETPKSISKKIMEIAEFSELGDFLDIPVKYYSSGMFVRLAFSVSTSINPDILLLDEIVAAGDAGFLKKAKNRMNEMMEKAKIIVMVTHSMQDALNMCNRCIWMEKGQIIMDGRPENVVKSYINNY